MVHSSWYVSIINQLVCRKNARKPSVNGKSPPLSWIFSTKSYDITTMVAVNGRTGSTNPWSILPGAVRCGVLQLDVTTGYGELWQLPLDTAGYASIFGGFHPWLQDDPTS